jgi:ABC-2 type transport system permease protein
VLVLGKYLASVGLFLAMLLGVGAHLLVLFLFGSPEWGPVLTGLLGLLLNGAAYLAVGLFFSCLTQNQVVAGATSFALFLSLWLFQWLGTVTEGLLSTVLTYVSFAGHFQTFGQGVLDSSDIVFYLSLIGLGLYASVQAVLATRWKA